jgi:1-acyl-sn-glycerol-3-phosphate acyltransferase
VIRALWTIVAVVSLTAFYSTRVVIDHHVTKRKDRSCRCDSLSRTWCRLVLRVAGVRATLEGAERVDWKQPSVVVANHQSWFDVFTLVAVLPGRVRFVAKEELGRIPIFGTAWRACGHIAINREDRRSAIESLDRAAEWVRKESLTMTLFPEGTRSPDGRLQEFKKGAFVLALKTGLPIVPVGISGTGAVMPKGSFKVRPGEVIVRVGDPIIPSGDWEAGRDELRARSRAAVALLIGGSDEAGPARSHEHSAETSE